MSYDMSFVTILSQFTFCTRWLLPPRHRRLRDSDPIFHLSALEEALRRAPRIQLSANIFTSWTMEIQMYTSYDAKLANHRLIDKNVSDQNFLSHQVAFHKCKSCKSNLLGHQVAALHHLPRQLAWPVAWLMLMLWCKFNIEILPGRNWEFRSAFLPLRGRLISSCWWWEQVW